MKKYFSYLSIALVTFVFASCGLKGNHTSSRMVGANLLYMILKLR